MRNAGWRTIRLKPGRKKILADIIDAHLNKKYTLSIPVEAMAQISFKTKQYFQRKREDKIQYGQRIYKIRPASQLCQALQQNSYGRIAH